jgi:putative FMN-dependent luciferase-like monooxygenase
MGPPASVLTNHRHPEPPVGKQPFRLGVFTRLVDEAPAPEVYRRALALFRRAEELGVDTAWVAQHHFHKDGGLPAPLVFLAAVAAQTSQLRLATGIVTLPLESPVRLAEDAAVLNALSGGRFELGLGTGGAEVVFPLFGKQFEQRHEAYDKAYSFLVDAFDAKELVSDHSKLFPSARTLRATLWEATFGVDGAIRAAKHGNGLLLARTAVRRKPPDGVRLAHEPLGDVQTPLAEAYLEHFDRGAGPPRIGLSRSLYVAPTHAEAMADAVNGIKRFAVKVAERSGLDPAWPVEELLERSDVHIGSPEEVVASLKRDRLLSVATDLILQVHPVDPSPEKSLRSLELLATEVAPALGWRPDAWPVGDEEEQGDRRHNDTDDPGRHSTARGRRAHTEYDRKRVRP